VRVKNLPHSCGNHTPACENHILRAKITLIRVEITHGRVLDLSNDDIVHPVIIRKKKFTLNIVFCVDPLGEQRNYFVVMNKDLIK
jgi:hypothetical protein